MAIGYLSKILFTLKNPVYLVILSNIEMIWYNMILTINRQYYFKE